MVIAFGRWVGVVVVLWFVVICGLLASWWFAWLWLCLLLRFIVCVWFVC